ncbi:L,D-transpeptidase [Saccharopolyspora sp. K220]|uniref:L,D-transpeptidase n=1 Tax=Saccharopolyspora soli TaxID=2926618 RepID=UPI001F58AC83|nr:L,D-transpeptidase [Saccharopolyspora soli]MCI2423570.1 L,D-transpeptidase [Saccharopolyspora soli]
MRGTKIVPGLLISVLLAACSAQEDRQPVPAENPPPLASPAPPPQPKPPCGAEAAACVSLSAGMAWLQRGGVVIAGPVPMMPGKPSEPTPVGVFQVEWKDEEHHSSEFDIPMPNSVFFAPGGIAFHAGPLDVPSHGCIHLSEPDSKRFFDELAVGDVVVGGGWGGGGGPPPPPPHDPVAIEAPLGIRISDDLARSALTAHSDGLTNATQSSAVASFSPVTTG